jgi:hypothetical protein
MKLLPASPTCVCVCVLVPVSCHYYSLLRVRV